MKRLVTFRDGDYIEAQVMFEKNVTEVVKRFTDNYEKKGYELISIVRIYD